MMGRAIVTYFSITGVTAGVASILAKAVGADLFEIKPDIPYENVNTDWKSQESGTADRREEPEALSQITFQHLDLDEYDTIYLGLPIWWYAAPTIINNFLDGYDLTGKTVIPFATSGGGGIDKVRPRLLSSCTGADLKEATLLCGEYTEKELAEWADSITKP